MIESEVSANASLILLQNANFSLSDSVCNDKHGAIFAKCLTSANLHFTSTIFDRFDCIVMFQGAELNLIAERVCITNSNSGISFIAEVSQQFNLNYLGCQAKGGKSFLNLRSTASQASSLEVQESNLADFESDCIHLN